MTKIKTTRRNFLITSGITTVGLAVDRRTLGSMLTPDDQLTLYVGTYTSGTPGPLGRSEGIYIYRMNPATAELSFYKVIKGVEDPSFLAFDPKRRRLYAVNEVEQFQGKPSGAVSSFAIDKKTGNLSFINKQATAGAAPCHLVVDESGENVLVANYGGSVALLRIKDDGSLEPASNVIQHSGSSVNRDRQQGPHAHHIVLDRANRYALAVDLGLDKVLVYKFDDDKGTLTANKTPWVAVNPGDGPRHLAFHPKGKLAYVINELSNTIIAFRYDRDDGVLQKIQTVSTLPAGFSGASWTAEILIDESGKFLYGSNRGHNSIVSFAIDEDSGMLSYIEHVSTQGKHPRHFTIEPGGNFLLVANRDSDSIVSFRIDRSNGRLQKTGRETKVPKPVCLLF